MAHLKLLKSAIPEHLPYGKVMAEAGREEGFVVAEIDTDVIGEARQRRRYLQDYRASLFLNPGFYR